MGQSQAKALGHPSLPIVIIPHPFGSQSRASVRQIAEQCMLDIARVVCEAGPAPAQSTQAGPRAAMIEVGDDLDTVNQLFRERRWSDGLPIVPPTAERVARMLRGTARSRDEVVAIVAPGFGAASVELIAVNAVLAGCDPEYMPVLIAAVEAMTSPKFNLQGIQASTNPAGVWMIVNGPLAKRLGMNSGINALGHGNWANSTMGRALRLILQNIGRALPGELDRSTLGQPGKHLFCCAENEEQSPWEPLHVERGYRADQSTVTVVGAEGTLNMNTHSKDAAEMIRVMAETIRRPTGNDYCKGGDPWMVLSPEHAAILKAGGLTKAEVKRMLWEASRLPANRMAVIDMKRTMNRRQAELGEIRVDTLLPICVVPEGLGIIVCGGPGTHSAHVSSFGNTRSVTSEIDCSRP